MLLVCFLACFDKKKHCNIFLYFERIAELKGNWSVEIGKTTCLGNQCKTLVRGRIWIHICPQSHGRRSARKISKIWFSQFHCVYSHFSHRFHKKRISQWSFFYSIAYSANPLPNIVSYFPQNVYIYRFWHCVHVLLLLLHKKKTPTIFCCICVTIVSIFFCIFLSISCFASPHGKHIIWKYPPKKTHTHSNWHNPLSHRYHMVPPIRL